MAFQQYQEAHPEESLAQLEEDFQQEQAAAFDRISADLEALGVLDDAYLAKIQS
jgi:hypothetical protein